MQKIYLETLSILHSFSNFFLEEMRMALKKLDIEDINICQAFIIFTIGDESIFFRELAKSNNCTKSNLSFNIKKMQSQGYVLKTSISHNKTILKLSLSEKGLDLYRKLEQIMNEKEAKIKNIHKVLSKVDII